MTELENIKSKIKDLYENSPEIHINVMISHPKTVIKNDVATIKGVYSHVFRIEEHSKDTPQCHTIQYTDIMTGRIEIAELKK